MWIFGNKINAIAFIIFYVQNAYCHNLNYNENLEESIKFYVYTRKNVETPQHLKADVESIIRSVLNPLKPTTFAIHGLKGNKSSEESLIIKDSKLKVEDGNIIVVDYSSLNEDSITVAHFTAKAIADLILLLQESFDMNLKNIHIVGFSLGAQISGLAGQYVYQSSGERIKRITALDPAGNEFNETTPANEKLTPDDADYVEVIHTNVGFYGYGEPCGHVDYYVNGGKIQPGCQVTDNVCSHNRAFELIPEMWSPVENLELLLLKCGNLDYIGLDNCRWRNEKMGGLEAELEGFYYVETNSNSPYGKGAFKSQFF